MVRTYRIVPAPFNPRPGTRPVNRLDSPPASGLFTKVPSRPTNHSKVAGKCGRPRCIECHVPPATKAAHRAKGARKLRVAERLDHLAGLDWSSARGILDIWYGGYMDDDDDDDESDGHDRCQDA